MSVCPIVHYKILGLAGAKEQIILLTPDTEPLHLGKQTHHYQPHHSGVISKLDNGVAGVGGGAVCIAGVEQGTPHTAWWGAGTEVEGCRHVGPYTNPLGVGCQEVQNEEAYGAGQAEFL